MSKEKKVRHNIEKHLSAIQKCVDAAMDGVSVWLKNKPDSLQHFFDIVNAEEHKADIIRRDIYEQLGDGAYLPVLRGDIHKLVQIVDELGGDAKEVLKILVLEKLEPVEELQELVSVVKKTEQQAKSLFDMAIGFFIKPKVRARDLKEHISVVTQLEQEIDNLEIKSIERIFGSSLLLAQKLFLKQFVSQLVHLSDQIQDIAETLSELNVKMQI